ncbi:MAG: hypothetical protein KGM42_10380 [Hyphomicrobiales bacterium]|nr:hypothetical protein [Hyphomicrobiales bacterium]
MRKPFARVFWTALALVFLIEAWLWDALGAGLGAVAAALPVERLRRSLKALLARAPAGASLVLFALPVIVILPFKLVGVALVAKGRVMGGCAVFLLAKTVGLGFTAFVYDVSADRLLTLDWFVRLRAYVLMLRDWAHRQVEPYRIMLVRLRGRLVRRLSGRAAPFVQRIVMLRARARRPV